MSIKEEIDKILGSVTIKRFSKQLLKDTLSEEEEDCGLLFMEEIVIDTIDDIAYCYMIFEDVSYDKFYRVAYCYGVNENNLAAFDGDPGMIECTEVQSVKVEVQEWCEVRK